MSRKKSSCVCSVSLTTCNSSIPSQRLVIRTNPATAPKTAPPKDRQTTDADRRVVAPHQSDSPTRYATSEFGQLPTRFSSLSQHAAPSGRVYLVDLDSSNETARDLNSFALESEGDLNAWTLS
jgi:hypothetical protein